MPVLTVTKNNSLNSVLFFTQSYCTTSEDMEYSTQVIWITFMILLWCFCILSLVLEEPPDVGTGITYNEKWQKTSWLTYFALLCFCSRITCCIENRSGFVFFTCGVSALLCLSKAHVSWSISSCRSERQRKEKPWEKRVCVLPSPIFNSCWQAMPMKAFEMNLI